jgi:hypothetical protein
MADNLTGPFDAVMKIRLKCGQVESDSGRKLEIQPSSQDSRNRFIGATVRWRTAPGMRFAVRGAGRARS